MHIKGQSRHIRNTKQWWQIATLLILVLLLGACHNSHQKVLVLNDFERDADLNRLLWKCRTTYSLSKKNATHGKKCLKLTAYPAAYPGLGLLLNNKEHDWRGYQKLCIDLLNPSQNELRLNYRLDDQRNPSYTDRVNGHLQVKSGLNRIKLDIAALRTSGTDRQLNLGKIRSVLFFFSSPKKPTVLYVDFIRLQK